ncbi:hypothetical protein M0802_010752 [Mischocyttarus mexicanus]|nr:hypothetical protein M0802_010752 [Mischocyttarus mexicanus]
MSDNLSQRLPCSYRKAYLIITHLAKNQKSSRKQPSHNLSSSSSLQLVSSPTRAFRRKSSRSQALSSHGRKTSKDYSVESSERVSPPRSLSSLVSVPNHN